MDTTKYHVEGANEYNIWYGKYLGEQDNSADKEPASDRCVLEKDAGYTKADGGGLARMERRSFCLHFARGICIKGDECGFYHRVPIPDDDARCDEVYDCFGRQRHSTHRDDMKGVGSFLNPSRTLFVGGLKKYATPKDLEDCVWRHFSEWGELENVNVIHRLSIGFPRYRLRTSAEFAKAAMSNQALDDGEILSIRWAKDDPNPKAREAIDRSDQDAIIGLLEAKGLSMKPAGFEYPSDYQLPDSKRIRLDEKGDDVPNDLLYPDTDNQYVVSSNDDVISTTIDTNIVSNSGTSSMTPEEYAAYCQQYYSLTPASTTGFSTSDYLTTKESTTIVTSEEVSKSSNGVAENESNQEESLLLNSRKRFLESFL